ncbi:hypothetical protein DVH24_000869 [Malus domestica]|uniref:Uncharacterized protein n=1 Tax=Malus domestica TaxID=3750 RepID=A0A498K3W1_MALDO|nr:hypothetical protein DVH24_000869 [Malus domestica]
MEPAKSGSQSNKVLFVKKIDRPPPEEFEPDNESESLRVWTRKLELNAIKYQVKLCKGSSKKYTQLNAEDNTTMCCSDHGVSGTKNSSCER